MPGQRLRSLAPKNASAVYESSVAVGVEALNMARWRLHCATGNDVESSDVVSASAVGAVCMRVGTSVVSLK